MPGVDAGGCAGCTCANANAMARPHNPAHSAFLAMPVNRCLKAAPEHPINLNMLNLLLRHSVVDKPEHAAGQRPIRARCCYQDNASNRPASQLHTPVVRAV